MSHHHRSILPPEHAPGVAVAGQRVPPQLRPAQPVLTRGLLVILYAAVTEHDVVSMRRTVWHCADYERWPTGWHG
jgi:hypothetical protein